MKVKAFLVALALAILTPAALVSPASAVDVTTGPAVVAVDSASPATPIQNGTPPEPRYLGQTTARNMGPQTFGAWHYWQPLNWGYYDAGMIPYNDQQVLLAGVYFGPKAGGWCLYYTWNMQGPYRAYSTQYLNSNTAYHMGDWGTTPKFVQIALYPRNYGSCPVRYY